MYRIVARICLGIIAIAVACLVAHAFASCSSVKPAVTPVPAAPVVQEKFAAQQDSIGRRQARQAEWGTEPRTPYLAR